MGRKRLTRLELPERVYFEHGAFYHRLKGRRIRLGRSLDESMNVLRQIGVTAAAVDVGHLSQAFWHARKNAKVRAMEFKLTRADLAIIWERSGGRCELTGLKFDLFKRNEYRRRPFAPSIDRIDSATGYSASNCRLVVVAINLAMNEWGHEVFAKIAAGYLRKYSTLKNCSTRAEI